MENRNPGIVTHISWVYTEDLDKSASFYADVLGLECVRDVGGARIFATLEGAAIGVCRIYADRVVEPRGGMISIVTDEVDAWYQRLLDKGADITQPPHRLEQFGIYTFFVADPDGYVIEFQQFDC